MSHGVRGCIKGLCLSVIYTASVYLCPAVRRKGRVIPSSAHDAAFELKVPLNPAAPRSNHARAGFIGRVFTSFPLHRGLSVFSVHEAASDYEACPRTFLSGVNKKINVKEKQGAPHPDKSVDVPHRTSLDILRATLNLARGNIEDQFVPVF